MSLTVLTFVPDILIIKDMYAGRKQEIATSCNVKVEGSGAGFLNRGSADP
jgi:hypothetical protein